MMKYDEDLGEIILRHNTRAVHYSIRIVNGHVVATVPNNGSEREALDFVEQKRERLLTLLKNAAPTLVFDEKTELLTQTFCLKIIRNDLTHIYYSLKDGCLTISCPQKADIQDDYIQKQIKHIITEALRHEAKRVLPSRLKELATLHGFEYSAVKINNSRSHWGSCTIRKGINISLSVMLLPEYLSDYIMLHELCHTREMNHGIGFWALMDKVTGGKTAIYRKDLKNRKMFPQ
ncbi:MAG: M48 family metallopeptidase [Tannerella sp.]|jgi:predicted metal-dependent hydrolase|nr:M48 family metallopeptidase [Tannerella sp.]